MKKNRNEEPKLWVTVLKLLVGLVVIIGSVGFALWMAMKAEEANGPPLSGDKSWGIVNDNPLRKKF
ncbi:MAG: hypothetical protein WCK83_14510 [Burkholderiales bacterium]|nr:hypothetical protein [Burkholderiales bacterium]